MSDGHDSLDVPAREFDAAEVLRALPEPVFVFHPLRDATGKLVDLRYELVNAATSRLYGMEVADIVGRRQLELFPATAEAGIVDFYAECLDSGKPGTFEVPWFDDGGVEGAFLLSAIPHGEVLLVTAYDITRRVTAEREAVSSQLAYRQLAEAASDVVYRVNLATEIEWVSPSVTSILGWTPEELIGRRGLDFVHPDERDAALASLAPLVEQGGFAEMRGRLRSKCGDYHWVDLRFGPTTAVDGTVTGFVGSSRDIHSEVEAIAALEASRHRYRLLAQNASDVVLASTVEGTYTWVSDSAAEVLGWQPADLVGRAAPEFVHPDDTEGLRHQFETAGTVPDRGEFRYRCGDGSYRWFAWTNRVTEDEATGQTRFVGSMVDISERRRVQELLAHAATHDSLTDLANRLVLMERADSAVAHDMADGLSRTALLLLDLDHFKFINDTLGHEVGDQVLVAAAERVKKVAVAAEVVARLGGDEMAALLIGVEVPEDAMDVARRLVHAFREPLHVGEREIFTTVSVGVAMLDVLARGEEVIDLLREADTALYSAKDHGRDRAVWFTRDMHEAVEHRIEIERDLRLAMQRNEFEVWFQPEVDLADGSLRAVEALLRWRQPGGGVRSAGEFIEAAEGSGLILDLGMRVVDSALAQAARWQTELGAVAPTVRINLSPLQLAEAGFLAEVDELIERYAVRPDGVCFEITEMVMLHDSSTVQSNLAGIRDRGIALAVDDFGTGYASLTYLHRYPIAVLKIDRSFIRHITTEERDLRLVAGILAFAERMGIGVVAEGVETIEQADLLRELGCTSVQGFLYSPAVPPGQISPTHRY